jgi:hypothetical protein
VQPVDVYEDRCLTSSLQQDGRLLGAPEDHRRDTKDADIPNEAEVGWSKEAYMTVLGSDLDLLLECEEGEWD